MNFWKKAKAILKAKLRAFQQDLNSHKGTQAFMIVAAPW